jgi:23S rRNA (adenine2503-C2)-methyltransferase
MAINIKALSEKELLEFIEKFGQKPYRARQISHWLYRKYATSFDEMTDLPKSLRETLKKSAYISNLVVLKKITSKDNTQKFLFKLEDGETIESVLIPDKKRFTLCISSQAGCAMGCKFCLTGMIGLRRNLKAYEIIDQIISVQRMLLNSKNRITNIVFMGMGEPLHNFVEVTESIRRIVSVLGFSKRRVTLSTAGIVPKILEIAKTSLKINLAISLNATTDRIRNMLMPLNRRYPLKDLLEACKRFPLEPQRKITFEYVLLKGINDSHEDAIRLVSMVKGIPSKINLIPYNPPSRNVFLEKQRVPMRQFKKSGEKETHAFQQILTKAGITALIRKSKGADISAACGQLRGNYLPSSS